MDRANTGVCLRERPSNRDKWDLLSVCSLDRRQMWADLNDIAGTALATCCYVTITNSSPHCLMLNAYGGDDRYSDYLFDVKRMFPHACEDLPEAAACLLPGYSSGVAQRVLSVAEMQVYDGYISVSLRAGGRLYTTALCWHEWRYEEGISATKPGVNVTSIACETGVIEGVVGDEQELRSDGYLSGKLTPTESLDFCHSTYSGDGTELNILRKMTRDFVVMCTYRRSAFHFEILPLPPDCAEKCTDFHASDLQEGVRGNVLVKQLETLAVQIPDMTFCCLCIENNLSITLQSPVKTSITGYFFTPIDCIGPLPSYHRLGAVHSRSRVQAAVGEGEGEGRGRVCSGWISYNLKFSRDDYVFCIGWSVDSKREEYTAGVEIRIVPKLLDNQAVKINRNGVNEYGDVVDAELFVNSIQPPLKCHAVESDDNLSSKRKRKMSKHKDTLTVPEIIIVGRIKASVMFTKEQYRFTIENAPQYI
jgi:hypothetical protein